MRAFNGTARVRRCEAMFLVCYRYKSGRAECSASSGWRRCESYAVKDGLCALHPRRVWLEGDEYKASATYDATGKPPL